MVRAADHISGRCPLSLRRGAFFFPRERPGGGGHASITGAEHTQDFAHLFVTVLVVNDDDDCDCHVLPSQ